MIFSLKRAVIIGAADIRLNAGQAPERLYSCTWGLRVPLCHCLVREGQAPATHLPDEWSAFGMRSMASISYSHLFHAM